MLEDHPTTQDLARGDQVFGRNLFYFYKALKNYDAESSVGTSWANQATVGSSTTATRSFGVSLRASF